jgi:hypothetical protein
MSKVTWKNCAGCHDDFYNHNRCGLNEESGQPRCWSMESATMEKRLLIPLDMRPPYPHIKPQKVPSCYRKPRHVTVKPESLTKEGYWK